MKSDRKREPGFYWVRFEGEILVAEYSDGSACTWDRVPMVNHWHVTGSPDCFRNREVCEVLSPRLDPPFVMPTLAGMTFAGAEAAGRADYERITGQQNPEDHEQ